jgi:Xaa-Pro aminopeptidase
MSMNRRSVVTGLAAGSSALLAAASETPRVLTSAVGNGADPRLVSVRLPYHTGPLFDRARATEIMTRRGLSGLVLGHPINVLHTTGHEGAAWASSYLSSSGAYALVSRDPSRPIGLVMSSFNYYWSYANIHRDASVAVFQYTQARAPDDKEASNNDSIQATGLPPLKAGEVAVFRDRQQAPLDKLERERRDRARAQASAHGVADSLPAALARAIKDLGLEKGRIGVDVPTGTSDWASIAAQAPNAKVEDGQTAVALIRLVKTPVEIEMMRTAARGNAEAAHAACQAIRAGASYRDLRATFFSETARRGGLGVWIIVDRMKADSYEAIFRDGQSFLIDAVATYAGYHGDYGRTVFVGEPSKSMLQHTKAIQHAWSDVRERLRPGLRYSDIQALGQDALNKGGYDTAVRITPHSVGLFHTDARGLGDIVLEKGMIISVDFPVLETGIGGSAHLEDLTLITADGHVVLNDTSDPTITV